MTPHETAEALPYPMLARCIEKLLTDKAVLVPARLVQAIPGGASLFVMPAHDAKFAITKLLTFTPNNADTDRATIQGDILVFEIATGRRVNLLDGPAVTARRTAAVSLLAAQKLGTRRTGSRPEGPMLIVGAGVQGRAHLDAFRGGLGIEEVWIHSRSPSSSMALMAHARTLGMRTKKVDDSNAALSACPYVISTTPAQEVVRLPTRWP